MSSSEEENFNIDISEDESEEDYAPVAKKKTTTTVRSVSRPLGVERLIYVLPEGTEEWREEYHEANR